MEVDFSQGGYGGDITEETFALLTKPRMPFWWQFREVLRASPQTSDKWKHVDGSALAPNEHKELIALSLTNYHVYTGLAEAISFFEQMQFAIFRTTSAQERVFEVRRSWKAMYSSLYSSFTALSNIVCIVAIKKSAFGKDPSKGIQNYSPSNAIKYTEGNHDKLAKPLRRINDRLEIRHHLAHYWTIWLQIVQGHFLIDKNFRKGYVSLVPPSKEEEMIDGAKLAKEHLFDSLDDYNVIYRELAIKGGFLDQYLKANGWIVDYSDFGPPHNRSRPLP
jgi:hypothetical protein